MSKQQFLLTTKYQLNFHPMLCDHYDFAVYNNADWNEYAILKAVKNTYSSWANLRTPSAISTYY